MNIQNNQTVLVESSINSLSKDKDIANEELNKKPPVDVKNVTSQNELERTKTVNEAEKTTGKIIDIQV